MPDPTVLIVEDESIVALDLLEQLRPLGFNPVGTTGTGEEACRLAGELKPDLILMDIHLGGEMDGVEAAEIIRRDFNVPVVFLTAFTDDKTLKRARASGPFGYVVKPFDAKQLQTTLTLARQNFVNQQQLFESRDILNGLLHTASEGFFILGEEGDFLEANDAYCDMLGYSREELLGMAGSQVEADDDQETIRNNVGKIRRTGRMRLRKRHRTRSGEILDVELNASCFETVTGARVCVFCRDITERLRREKLIRLQTNALAAAANAVVITRETGEIEWVNRAFSTFTGYTPDEAVGHLPGKLLKSGRHDREYYRNMWETIKRGEVWRGEIVNRRKNGEEYEEEMTITPLHDEEGAITHYIAIKQDISERKNLERMFHRAQRLESIGTLASGVAHDLNNVLSPIMMSADLMRVQIEDGRFLEMLDMIRSSAKRGGEIVRQLLSFARGGEGDKTEVQLRHLLKEMVKIFRETFPKNITLDERIALDLPPVKGDSTQLHQVFTNLMINARDAMEAGGDLLLRADTARVDGDYNPQARHLEPGEYVRVQVADQGTGIPDAIREQIFDPFFTTKSSGKGTGLGLATALGIVRSHNGALLLDSTPGRGSTFEVLLPVLRGGGERGESEPKTLPEGKGERLLVVDDEESIRFMLRSTLATLGYEVDLASNGIEGLQRMETAGDPYDLVLLDMMMPKMDGAEFMRKLRELEIHQNVLVMSGMAPEEKFEEAGISMETDYLPKPFTIDQLARKLRSKLGN